LTSSVNREYGSNFARLVDELGVEVRLVATVDVGGAVDTVGAGDILTTDDTGCWVGADGSGWCAGTDDTGGRVGTVDTIDEIGAAGNGLCMVSLFGVPDSAFSTL
jgi:hypothetical protein